MMKTPDGPMQGYLEDAGKSMLICDNPDCEHIVSKGGRYEDGDRCPECEQRDDTADTTDDAVIRAANAYGRK